MKGLLTWTALFVFILSILVDCLWALYIRRSSEGKSLQAANFAALLMACGSINVINYLENKWLLIPIIAGNWIGTFFMVRLDHSNKKIKG